MKKRLKIGFDVDDTIINFTQHVLRELGLDPNNKVDWGFKNFPEDIRKKAFELFRSGDFIKSVPMEEEEKLKNFITTISKDHDVFFVTATYPESATERILYLERHFPTVETGHMIIAGNKEIFDFDIFFDDRFENLKGGSKHRVLYNRHWNKGVTRFPIVRSLDDMIEITNMVINGATKTELFKKYKSKNINNDSIILIQGHTGAGKNFLIEEYFRRNPNTNIERVKTVTTRKPRPNEDLSNYKFVTKDKFLNMIEENKFIEHTVYGDNYYGSEVEELKRIMSQGKRPLLIVDSNGVEAFNKYYMNVIDIYLYRDINETIRSIISRDKDVKRIEKLLDDLKCMDAHKCRVEIANTGDPDKLIRDFENCIIN